MKNLNEQLRAVVEDDRFEGLAQDKDGNWFVDLRYTPEAVAAMGVSPITADFNICGPVIVYLSQLEAEALGAECPDA